MQYEEYLLNLKKVLSIGTVFPNPGGGTSTIISFENDIRYLRGKSTIRVSPKVFYDAYEKFKGSKVTSNDLKKFYPKVFDLHNNGHPCNCTFFFSNTFGIRFN